jgi:DNA polymerase I-like protein with 3'-5' exonuclease and polymerase domains
MQTPDVVVVDFETHPIEQRPHYPPKPAGVATQWPDDDEPGYWGWGHPVGNTVSQQSVATAELRRVWDSGLPILFHNAKFDLAVAYEKLKLPRLPWDRVHDTMFLAYLCDPHARSLGLKQLAEDLLSEPPTEQDELHDWIWQHRQTLEITYAHLGYGKVKKTQLGAWIFAAPGELVGRYACGDVRRTKALFEHLYPLVHREGMGAAYDRERALTPILMENEEVGIRVDLEGLQIDGTLYSEDLETAERWLRKELRASGLNFDADSDVAAVLAQRGIVTEWQETKTGKRSVSKDNLLPEHFSDPRIASALGYRNRLKTCLEMFMKPWYEQGSQRKGYISTNWNQTRGEGGGTRTGRPSTSNPNFLNISKDFEGRDDGYRHPDFLGVAKLPLVRRYILPDEGDVFLHRDFDGQELRVFAHYEQGDLFEKYVGNPQLDPHAFIGEELKRVAGRELPRGNVKIMNFQSLYGGGVPALQKKLRCSYTEAKELKAFHNKALPGRVILNEEIKRIVSRGDPIRTWGGRLYYPEKPGEDGRSKIYKLINYIVQGSAADLTKQCLIDWYSNGIDARFLVTVYDEINLSCPTGVEAQEMGLLKETMEEPRLTVPMRSSGKMGPSWGELTKCE